MMKILALSIVFSVGLSAPSFAQSANVAGSNPPADTSADVIDESLILEASSLEDRAALLRRCAGPPPKAMIASGKQKQAPISEPIAVSERVEPVANNRGG
jgi:hypothetical protein